MSSVKYWLWLTTRNTIGPRRGGELLRHFGTPEMVYKAEDRDYLDIDGIGTSEIKQLMDKDLTEANKILSSCAQTGCQVLTHHDSTYPDRLRNIYDPPLVLYIKGHLPNIDDEPVVGVVGTRACTPYGITVAENVGYDLSSNGIIVVTGLARGVDTAATKGALYGGSCVIGVIGSGPDVIYPPENKGIYEDVESAGVILSEYPPGTPAVACNFPARNRIISGISIGVAVIEAPKKSGALITAARALEQGRDVFTLPGNVDAAACEGSNALLREGAIPFIGAADIIDEYIDIYPDKIGPDIKRETTAKIKKSFDNKSKVDYIDLGNLLDKLEDEEKIIAQSLKCGSLHIDEIISQTGFSAQKVLASLTMLELGSYVQRNNNGKWEIAV